MRHIVITGCWIGMLLVVGCCANFESVEPTPQARQYESEASRHIDEDLRRLADGEPLKHHDSEKELRRHEFERDFYNDFYRSSAQDERRHREAIRPSAEQARRMFEGE